LKKLHGWDHARACREIDVILGSAAAPTTPSSKRRDGDARRRAARRLLDEANAPEVVGTYLTRRSLSARSVILRGHARCAYFDDNHRLIRYYPAVLAPIHGPDDTLQSVLRIYDAPLREGRKKPLSAIDTITGGGVRLFDFEEELGITEGVETALAVYELFKVPVWSALSANGLRKFQPPPRVRRLHIFGDFNDNYVGQAAAYDLAERVHGSEVTVEVHLPERMKSGQTDWLDVLNARGRL
jgi:putative DNA primase/helicase